jgi:hypothetical protein
MLAVSVLVVMNQLIKLTFAFNTFILVNNAIAGDTVNKTKQEQISQKFIQVQIDQNVTIGRAIKSMVGHYPQQAALIVNIALDLYPQKYKEIIHAAISAQPTLTDEVVTMALDKNLSSCASIVETAINADPSYIDFVVTAAANSTPEQLSEIVRIAVVTEPDSADYIVQALTKDHPNKIVEILSSAIIAVPFVGEYVVEALLAVFPNDAEKVITTAIRESSTERDNIKRIIEIAQNSGVDPKKIKVYALNGGATNEELSEVLDKL